MKIFSFNSNSGSQQLKITEDDRHWVEENFRWLKEVFGYPNRAEEQVLLTPKFFPATSFHFFASLRLCAQKQFISDSPQTPVSSAA